VKPEWIDRFLQKFTPYNEHKKMIKKIKVWDLDSNIKVEILHFAINPEWRNNFVKTCTKS